MKSKYWTILGYGILTWMIPFVVSMFCYNQQGKCIMDLMLFKSIMILIGTAVGVWLLVKYLKTSKAKDLVKEGLIVGFIWVLINYVLDYAILIKLFNMSLAGWFNGIGLRYLALPIIAVGLGAMKRK